MRHKYIAMSFSSYGGYYGSGSTIDEAKKELRKAGGRKKDGAKIWLFTAKLPFAPANRDAEETEADAWIDRSGGMNWIRCEREEIALQVIA